MFRLSSLFLKLPLLFPFSRQLGKFRCCAVRAAFFCLSLTRPFRRYACRMDAGGTTRTSPSLRQGHAHLFFCARLSILVDGCRSALWRVPCFSGAGLFSLCELTDAYGVKVLQCSILPPPVPLFPPNSLTAFLSLSFFWERHPVGDDPVHGRHHPPSSSLWTTLL